MAASVFLSAAFRNLPARGWSSVGSRRVIVTGKPLVTLAEPRTLSAQRTPWQQDPSRRQDTGHQGKQRFQTIHTGDRCPLSAVGQPAIAKDKASAATREGLDPPGPRSLPMIGTMHKYLPIVGQYKTDDRQSADTKRYLEYGPVVREEAFPGQVVYYIYDPELFDDVIAEEPKYPNRFEMTGLKEYRETRGLHPGFPNAQGEEWNKIRQPTNRQMMRPGVVAKYVGKQNDVTGELLALMELRRDSHGEVPDLLDMFYRWSMECIGVIIFDTHLGTLKPVPHADSELFVRAANGAFETLYQTTFMWPLHKSKKTKVWKRLCESFEYIERLVEQQVEKTMSRENSSSFLRALSSEPTLDLSHVKAIVCDLFYGSVDTAAHTFSFTLFHLAKNPDVQRHLLDEIERHLPLGPDDVSPGAIERMKYIKAVVKETFRLTPVSAFGVVRTHEKDLYVAGYRLKAGCPVFLQPNVAAMSDKYFEDPEVFRPERWLRNGTSAHQNAFPLMPFGYGARMCPGKRFAEQQLYLGLIHILYKYELSYHHEDIKMKTRFSNQPDRPLRITFTPRTRNSQ